MKRIDRWQAELRRRLRASVGRAIRWRERWAGPYRHELAVCAIFRDEAPFLDEWLTFHAGIGASHFYLYDNFSTDNFRDVLRPWIARGMVTLTDWPVPVGQVPAYRHCIRQARRHCRWVAFIDVDEFLFSPEIIDVRDVLRRYADLPGVEVWEVFFGSGGHVARPKAPVTQAFLRRAPLSRTTAKSIANPRLVYRPGIHQNKYWIGEPLDTARRQVQPGIAPVLDVLRINHYWSRSIEDLKVKVGRGDASTSMARDAAWHFAFEQTLNAETDDTIVRTSRATLGGMH